MDNDRKLTLRIYGSFVISFVLANLIFTGLGISFQKYVASPFIVLFWCLLIIFGNIGGYITFQYVLEGSLTESLLKRVLEDVVVILNIHIYSFEGIILTFIFGGGWFLGIGGGICVVGWILKKIIKFDTFYLFYVISIVAIIAGIIFAWKIATIFLIQFIGQYFLGLVADSMMFHD